MPIVSSTYEVGHPQIDGRRYVVETHIDHLGANYTREYLAAPDTDFNAVLAANVELLNADLRAQELLWIEAELFAERNPFPSNNGDFSHVTRIEALGWLLARHVNDPAELIVKVAPLMSAVADEEMLALGMAAEQITGIRERVAAAVNIRAQIDAYNASLVNG